MTPEQAARTSIESQDGSPATAPDGIIQRRRRSDWDGRPRSEKVASEAYRAGIALSAASLAAHDGATAEHSDDVVEVSEAIAAHLGMSAEGCDHVAAVAQLHDIGKLALPTEILTKAGPLDENEWELVRRHTVEGERILSAVPEMTDVARVVRHTHERWDGGGYPDGLAGEEIPLAARIVFCADAFHAMRCDRPYRPGRPAREALAEIESNAGTQFDPEVAHALVDLAAEVRRKGAFGRLGRRSQRLAVLLATLVVSGSALAATGTWPELPGAGADESGGAADCTADSCAPVALGAIGVLPKAQPGAKASIDRGGPPPSRKNTSSAGSKNEDPGVPRGGPQGASGAGAGAGATQPAARPEPPKVKKLKAPKKPKPPKARTEAPGRSEQAPRRPQAPVRGNGGAPGRSDEAPGKPDGPGKFGQKD